MNLGQIPHYNSRLGQAPGQLPVAAQPARVTGHRVALLIWTPREPTIPQPDDKTAVFRYNPKNKIFCAMMMNSRGQEIHLKVN